jgi:hypothetical protein
LAKLNSNFDKNDRFLAKISKFPIRKLMILAKTAIRRPEWPGNPGSGLSVGIPDIRGALVFYTSPAGPSVRIGENHKSGLPELAKNGISWKLAKIANFWQKSPKMKKFW